MKRPLFGIKAFIVLSFLIIVAGCKKEEEPVAEKYLILKTPNGGNVMNVNSTCLVTWESNISDDINLLLFRDNYLVDTIKTNVINNGTYSWKLAPDYLADSTYKLKITSASDAFLSDMSDNYFTVISSQPIIPYIHVTYPNGGEVFQMGTYHWITWERNFSGLVKIYLLIDGYLWGEVPGNGTTENSMHAYFPTGFSVNATYRIMVAESGNIQLNDISDEDFYLCE